MFACLYAPGNLPLLVECARAFSPHIEEDAQAGTVVFDVRGLESLYGPPDALAREIDRRAGIPARIAIASNPDAAGHAARGFKGITVIERGKEAGVLAPLPLNLIGASAEAGEVLHMWGIRTFGQLAKLPPLGVAARLGDEGVLLQRLARGENDRQLRPIGEALVFREEMELDYPMELLEPLLFVISRMLHDLCGRLAARALATNRIDLVLALEPQGLHRASLKMPVPTIDIKTLLRLVQLELSGHPPKAPVVKVAMEALPVKPRRMQRGLFIPNSPEPEKLEITIARLRHLAGPEFVGSPALLDSYGPDRFEMRTFAPEPFVPGRIPNITERLALRRFRPPSYAHVLIASERPVHITAQNIRGRITTAKGPWRTSGEWWRSNEDAWDRDIWDIEMQTGGLYRLFFDNLTGRWFLEGIYD